MRRQPKRALRQHLVRVLRRLFHHVEDVADVVERHPCVEQIAHAVDEDQPRPAPAAGNVEATRDAASHRSPVRTSSRCRRPGTRACPSLQPPSQLQGVAVVAASADPIATGRGVPGRLRPLDRAVVGHDPETIGHASTCRTAFDDTPDRIIQSAVEVARHCRPHGLGWHELVFGPYLSRLELQKLVVRLLQAQGCLLGLRRGGSERLAQVADMFLVRFSDDGDSSSVRRARPAATCLAA